MLKSKEENINIFGMKTKFGGGRSSGFACVYDNVDARKKFDTKTGLLRVSFDLSYLILQDGFRTKPAKTRKQKKEIKARVKKVRGKEKTKAANAGKK